MLVQRSARWRRLSLAVAFALVVALAIAAQPCQAQTVDAAVSAIESHYRDLVDLTAKVVQKNHLKALGKTQTFEAQLWIRKPGRLRLDYTNGQVIVIDDNSALFYSQKSSQMIKKSFDDIERLNIPVAFLLSAARIRDSFDVYPSDAASLLRLDLVPKKKDAAMKKLVLGVDANGRISTLTIFDKSGNMTEIFFSEVQEGAGLDRKVFNFKPPAGTEIIEQ